MKSGDDSPVNWTSNQMNPSQNLFRITLFLRMLITCSDVYSQVKWRNKAKTSTIHIESDSHAAVLYRRYSLRRTVVFEERRKLARCSARDAF